MTKPRTRGARAPRPPADAPADDSVEAGHNLLVEFKIKKERAEQARGNAIVLVIKILMHINTLTKLGLTGFSAEVNTKKYFRVNYGHGLSTPWIDTAQFEFPIPATIEHFDAVIAAYDSLNTAWIQLEDAVIENDVRERDAKLRAEALALLSTEHKRVLGIR